MSDNLQANRRRIRELLRKNSLKLADDSFAAEQNYADKILILSEKVGEYCQHCEEAKNFQKMLMELAEDLPENANPPKAVHRSIQKRFKVIKNHLQGTHGLSFPNQFKDAGIVIGASVLGMAGFVVMAFNINFLYPLTGLLVGGLLGYLWGVKRDRKAHEEGTVIEWNENVSS